MSFKEEKFKKNIEANFDWVASLFAGDGNFIPNLKTLTESLLKPEMGIIGSREKGIRDRIRRMDDDITRKEANLSKRETALKRQFAQLEALTNNMQGQQQYLTQALGSPNLM